ncbi:unnamed protein product [Closterium sp. NIES-53]
MEVARTSMIHADAPHFLWPFAVRYATHQPNLWPRVSEPETSLTLRWTGKVGDASVFRVWGTLSLVRDATANKLSSRTLRCVFLGFPTDAPPWQFYHPRSRRVFYSQDVTFDESVCYYRLHPHASHPFPLAPLFLVPPPPPVDPLPPQGLAPLGVSQVDPPPLVEPLETAGGESGVAEPEGEGSGGATTRVAGSWGAATGVADSGGPMSPSGGGAVGDPAGGPGARQPPQPDLLETLLPQAIRAWIVWRGSPGGGGYGPAGAGAASPGGTAGGGGTRGTAGAGGAASAGGNTGAADAGGARATRPSGATAVAGAGPTSLGGTASAGGTVGARGDGAGGTGGAGVAGPGGAHTGGAGVVGAGGAVRTGGPTGAAGSGGTGGAAGAGAAGASGTAGDGGATGAAGTRGAGVTTGARGPRASGASGVAGAGGAGGAAAAAGATGAGGAGAAETALRRPFFYPQPQSSLPPPNSVIHQVLSLLSSTGLPLPLMYPPTDQSQPQLLPGFPLLAPAPHTEVTDALTERREPETRASTHVRAPCVACPRPPAVPSTHGMALHPSSISQRVVLPEPPASSVRHIHDPESDLALAASPTITRLLAIDVTNPELESTAAFALVTELVDFAARSRLDNVASLVTESESVFPPSVGGELALDNDVPEDKQYELECLATALPRFASMLLCPEGDPNALDIPTSRSYAEAIAGTYVDKVPPPGANIVDGMWIFIGVNFFQTFSPTPKMTTLQVLLYVAAQRDYELHSLDFSTAFLQGSLHEEIWLRRPPRFTGSFPAGTQWSLRWSVHGLRQAPREWHDTLRTTLAALGFDPSSAEPSLFLRIGTTLPPFYILVYVDDLVFATADTEALALVKAELQERHTCTDLGELRSYLGLEITRDRARRTITLTQSHMVHQVLQRFTFLFSSPQPTPLSTSHSLSAPPSDESVEPNGPYPELVGWLMYLMTCTRSELAYPLSLLARDVARGRHRKGSVVLTGHSDASWADDEANQRSSQGYTFSLGSGSVSWRSTRSSSVLSSSCEAEIYAGAMAAPELRWLTYQLGERPRSPPVVYVDNKAMLALCHEQRLEHRTKHIAICDFLARELQQRRQLRLSYVASRANTADVFTKALWSGDHQHFCVALGLVPILPHLLVALVVH